MDSPSADMPIIDYAKLLEMFMGNKEKVNYLINTLQTRVPQWQEEFQQALTSANHDDIRQVCHRIRGAAGTITAHRAAFYATALGESIKAGDFANLEQLAAQLNKSLTEISQFLPPTS